MRKFGKAGKRLRILLCLCLLTGLLPGMAVKTQAAGSAAPVAATADAADDTMSLYIQWHTDDAVGSGTSNNNIKNSYFYVTIDGTQHKMHFTVDSLEELNSTLAMTVQTRQLPSLAGMYSEIGKQRTFKGTINIYLTGNQGLRLGGVKVGQAISEPDKWEGYREEPYNPECVMLYVDRAQMTVVSASTQLPVNGETLTLPLTVNAWTQCGTDAAYAVNTTSGSIYPYRAYTSDVIVTGANGEEISGVTAKIENGQWVLSIQDTEGLYGQLGNSTQLQLNVSGKVRMRNANDLTTIDSQEQSVSTTVTLNRPTCTVTFDNQGDTTSTTVAYKSAVSAPNIATTAGNKTLVGWYRNSNFSGEPWDFDNDVVTGSMTLYAKWKTQISEDDVTLSPASYTYDRTEKKPTATVTVNGVTLSQGTDYTVAYENNINAGDQAKVIITGMGDYSGTVTKYFIIQKASSESYSVTVSDAVYDGTAKETAAVRFGATFLSEGTDYTAAYINNTNAGTAQVTVTGSNMDGSIVKTFTIFPAAVTPGIAGTTKEYDGTAAGTGASITLSGVVEKDRDKVSAAADIAHSGKDAGTTTVNASNIELTGEGSGNYTLNNVTTATAEGTITRRSIVVTAQNKSKTYGETDPALTYTADRLVAGEALTGSLTREAGENAGSYSILQGTLVTDDATNTNYTITSFIPAAFTIDPKPVTADVTLVSEVPIVYNGASQEPAVSVKLDGEELDSSEYTLSYSGNINKGTATVTANDADGGNYTVSGSATFQIRPCPVTVTPKAQCVDYGTAIVTGIDSVEISGLVSGHALSAVTVTTENRDVTDSGVLTASGAAIAAGDQDVTGNYDISYVPGTLTIQKTTPVIILADTYYPEPVTYNGDVLTDPAEAVAVSGAYSSDLHFKWEKDGAETERPSDAGSYTLTVYIPASGNTEAVSVTRTVTVLPKSVKVSGITADNKIYDATTNVPLNYSQVILDGILTGQKLGITAEGTAIMPSVGVNIHVNISNITFRDTENGKAANYAVAQDSQTQTTVTILKKTLDAQLDVTNAHKVYDGTVNATAELNLVGIVDGDTDVTPVITYAYDTADAGENKIITATVTLNHHNYQMKQETYSAAGASISPRPVILTPDADQGKVYGDVEPTAYSYTVDNMVGNEPLADPLTREAGENVGEYAFKLKAAAAAENPNYSMTLCESPEPFVITRKEITDANTAIEMGNNLLYTDAQQTFRPQQVMTTLGNGSTEEADVSYSGDTAKHVGTYTLTVTGQNNYTGSLTRQWKILPNLAVLDGVTVDNVKLHEEDALSLLKKSLEEADDAAKRDYAETYQTVISLLERLRAVEDALNTPAIMATGSVTKENVQFSQEQQLKQAQRDYETALEQYAGNLTDQEEARIAEEIKRIQDALTAIENAEKVASMLQALPDAVEPDDLETAESIALAQAAMDQLTDHEKELVGSSLRDKLESLNADLLDYRIVKGDRSKWVKGSGIPLEIVANGPIQKFVSVSVDGEILDEKHYTIRSGSTVVTLHADYLQSLRSRKHSIQITYTDGQTPEAVFQVVTNSGNPFTGDETRTALYGGIMLLSLLCMVMTVLFCLRRKENSKR